jgi:hypothetical protein
MGIATAGRVLKKARFNERRRGKRMNSRVPVRVEWDGDDGKRIAVEAHTRIINPYGCMVVLQHSLEIEHRMVLANLATGNKGIAVVVWKGNPRPEGWEYGIELVAPEMDFWGIEL